MYDIEYVLKIAKKYHREAQECQKNKNFIAAFVMYGSCLEAFLLAVSFVCPEKVRSTNEYKKVKNNVKRKRGIFLEFGLNNLIEIARELKWLPLDEQIENIGIFEDWVRWLQESRNLVHPARWLKPDNYFGNVHEWMRKTPYKKYNKFVEISDEAVEGIREILLNRVEGDIVKRLTKETNQKSKK